MTTKRSTKSAILTSMLSIILCITMLLGSTFAWFSHTASSQSNRIVSGNLKVDLLMDKNKTGNVDEYVSIRDGFGDIFSEAAGNSFRWEPGKTEIVYLQVKNSGSQALRYNVELLVSGSNYGVLADALSFAVIEGKKAGNPEYATWEAIVEAADKTGGLSAGYVTVFSNGIALAKASDYFALVVHMDEDAGSEYMGENISIDVRVTATQAVEEQDSFSNTYDEHAVYDDFTDFVLNGSFEEVGRAVNAAPLSWTLANGDEDGNAIGTGEDDAADGNYHLKLTYSDTEVTAPVVSQKLLNYVAGTEITVTAYYRKTSGTTANPVMKLQFNNSSIGEKVFTGSGETFGAWVKMEETVVLPEKLHQLELFVTMADGTGEVHWDNISVTGRVNPNSVVVNDFYAMLTAEEENAMPVPEPEVTIDGVVNTDNWLKNSGFEEHDGTVASLKHWTPEDRGFDARLAVGQGIDGSDAIRLTSNGSANPFFVQDVYDITPGVVYKFSFWYKYVSGTNGNPVLKVESYINLDKGDDGVTTNTAGDNISAETVYRSDGEWHQIVGYFNFEDGTEDAKIYARILSGSDFDVLIDNVEMVFYSNPKVFDLHADSAFYYTDNRDKGGNANLEAIINTTYYPEYADNHVDFKVYDEETLIWESEKVTADSGVARVQFPLNVMTKKESPYRIIASVYNEEEKTVEVKHKDIYLYDRPKYMTEEGVFLRDGEPFYPVLGYHVQGEADIKKAVEEGGINVIQIGVFQNPDDLVKQLDLLQKYGAMGMVCMYLNMMPAGTEQNIPITVKVINDERVLNHPALFGFNISDEPFLYMTDPTTALENAYRVIREIDDKHPIMLVEYQEENVGISGGYVDCLIIDPYGTAASLDVYNFTSLASEHLKPQNKVFYPLVRAFGNDTTWPTKEDLRNTCWQALFGGAGGAGYYAISDPYKKDGKKYAVWNCPLDNGAVWDAIVEFDLKELPLAGKHFFEGEGTLFNKNLIGDYWYYSWVTDSGELYMVVLGMKEGQSLPVSIPLTSHNAAVSIGSYTAEIIAGPDAGSSINGNDTLSTTVDGVEVIFYKITPNAAIDTNSLK